MTNSIYNKAVANDYIHYGFFYRLSNRLDVRFKQFSRISLSNYQSKTTKFPLRSLQLTFGRQTQYLTGIN